MNLAVLIPCLGLIFLAPFPSWGQEGDCRSGVSIHGQSYELQRYPMSLYFCLPIDGKPKDQKKIPARVTDGETKTVQLSPEKYERLSSALLLASKELQAAKRDLPQKCDHALTLIVNLSGNTNRYTICKNSDDYILLMKIQEIIRDANDNSEAQ